MYETNNYSVVFPTSNQVEVPVQRGLMTSTTLYTLLEPLIASKVKAGDIFHDTLTDTFPYWLETNNKTGEQRTPHLASQ